MSEQKPHDQHDQYCNCGACTAKRYPWAVKTSDGQQLTREHAFSDVCRALQVLVLDRRTRAYLRVNDPKALQQAAKALHDLGLQYLVRSDIEESDLCWYCLRPLVRLDSAGTMACPDCRHDGQPVQPQPQQD